MAKTLLGAAARKAKLEIIDNPNDAEMAIVLGDSIPNDSALNGKNVWLGDISRAVAHHAQIGRASCRERVSSPV